MAKDKRNEANCNECVHGCVCQFKDEVMEALTKEKERPTRCFGGIGNHVASMGKEVWIECNYYNSMLLKEDAI